MGAESALDTRYLVVLLEFTVKAVRKTDARNECKSLEAYSLEISEEASIGKGDI